MLEKISYVIDACNSYIGKIMAWLPLAMVVITFYNVVIRYVFHQGTTFEAELVRMFHDAAFLLPAGYALLKEDHVRVDIFYQKFSVRRKAWVNIYGTVFLLFPFCISILYFSYDFVKNAWNIKEASKEPEGIQGVFLLKTMIWLYAIFLLLQGFSIICKSVILLKKEKEV